MTQQLATRQSEDMQLAHHDDIDIVAAVDKIAERAITSESVAALGGLFQLKIQQEDRRAKQQFMAAFFRARKKLKTVNATRGIPDKHGAIRYYTVNLEDVQNETDPILESEGLFTRFDSRREGNLCIGICWLSHSGGHQEKSECAVNAVNAMGGDLGALKIAKRGALIAMLGIKVEHDDDARILGDYVSAEDAAGLQSRLRAVRPNDAKAEERFLKLAGSPNWNEIRQGKFGELDRFLRAAEKSVPAGTTPVAAQSTPAAKADSPADSDPAKPADAAPDPAKKAADAAWDELCGKMPKANQAAREKAWQACLKKWFSSKSQEQMTAGDWESLANYISDFGPVVA